MSGSAIQEEATLLTAVLTMAQQAGSARGIEILMGYDEPPSQKQLEADHPEGSEGRHGVVAVLGLGETLGTYVKHGALTADLVNDLLWISGVWARTEQYVKDLRVSFNEESLYENFEALARTV